MSSDIGARIGIDGEKTFRDSLSAINSQIKSLNSEMKSVVSAFTGMEKSEDAVSAKSNVLQNTIAATEQKISLLSSQVNKAKSKLNDLGAALDSARKEFGENSAEAIKAQNAYNRQVSAINKLQTQLNGAKADLNNAQRQMKNLGNAADDTSKELDNAAESAGGFSDAFRGAFLGGAISGAVQSLISSIGNLVNETLEYRKILGTLDVSSKKAGYTAEETATTYEQLYSVVGDTQASATAAANLQALGLEQSKLTKLTDGVIGSWVKYQDSISTDTLAEAINETIQVGQATSAFSDVLNWAGRNEDAFNEKLQATQDPAERANIVLQELADQGLMEAAEGWRQNNSDIVELNKSSNDLNGTMAEFGKILTPIVVDAKKGFNNVLQSVLDIVNAFSSGGITSGIKAAENVLSNMINELQDMFPQILSTIQKNFPEALSAVTDVFTRLLENIKTKLPDSVSAISNIFNQIGKDLKENLPTLISEGLPFLTGFSDSLRENAGVLIDVGLELVKNIADGLINSLPVLIEKVPTIITNIAGIINDNAPKILATGVEIIANLAKGLISAIPVIVQNLPKIIEAVVAVFTAYNWLNLGKSLMTSLKDGIKSMTANIKTEATNILNSIKSALSSLPSALKNIASQGITGFINAIKSLISSVSSAAGSVKTTVINGIKSLPSTIKNIGKDIIDGLAKGLASGVVNLTASVREIADNVIETFKSVFEIHSPSKVMENEVGVMIGRGIGKGVEKSASYIKNTAKKVLNTLTSEINSINDKLAAISEENAKEQADQELKEYKKNLEEKYKELEQAEIEERQNILDEIASLEEEWNNKQIEKAKAAEEEKLQARLESLNALKEEYESALSEIEDKQQSMAETLQSYGELFTKVETDAGEILKLGDLQSDIDTINAYGKALEQLKERGISSDLLGEIQGLNVDEAMQYMDELLSLTDKEYSRYMSLWQEKQEAAQEVASEFYKEEIETLKDEMIGQMESYNSEFDQTGRYLMDGVAAGVRAGQSGVVESIKQALEAAVAAARQAMDINSPSGVYEKIGSYMAQGLDVGWTKKIKEVKNKVSSNLIDFMPNRDSFGNSIDNSRQYSNVSVNLYVDHINNGSNRDVRTLAKELNFMMKQQQAGKGGVLA